MHLLRTSAAWRPATTGITTFAAGAQLLPKIFLDQADHLRFSGLRNGIDEHDAAIAEEQFDGETTALRANANPSGCSRRGRRS